MNGFEKNLLERFFGVAISSSEMATVVSLCGGREAVAEWASAIRRAEAIMALYGGLDGVWAAEPPIRWILAHRRWVKLMAAGPSA